MEQDARKKPEIDESKKKPAVQSTFASPSREDDRPSSPVQPHPSPPQSIDTDKTLDINTAEDGGYWTLPSMPQILALRDIRAVSGFVVGRKGYGQVRFLQPVDLSQVRSIPDIPGSIVVFDLKICTVYPDETVKPPVGKGLNVPAIITLEKCWPLSKETRRPILDVENPRFIAHVERLKRQPDTEFIDYIADSGSWIFKVSHFSSYDALFDCLSV
jgi:nuclear pore complex protein Nup98-Nup96